MERKKIVHFSSTFRHFTSPPPLPPAITNKGHVKYVCKLLFVKIKR